jgi:spore cortex formation protein SpoVR/YcgB (stage V sporulation)
LRKTSPSFSYLTFANGGYIMMMRPMAIGMFVVPDWKRLTKPAVEGTKWPRATPIAMARKIHRVRKRSRNESFLRSTGAQVCP